MNISKRLDLVLYKQNLTPQHIMVVPQARNISYAVTIVDWINNQKLVYHSEIKTKHEQQASQ